MKYLKITQIFILQLVVDFRASLASDILQKEIFQGIYGQTTITYKAYNLRLSRGISSVTKEMNNNNFKGFIRQASPSDAFQINHLRLSAYKISKEFSIKDARLLEESFEDGKITLIASNSEGKILSTLRGNILFNKEQYLNEVQGELPYPLAFPSLYLSKAATLGGYQFKGIHSLLRYYFIEAALKAPVATISGHVLAGAPRLNFMRELGYEFHKNNEFWFKHISPHCPQFIAVLNCDKFISARKVIADTHSELLEEYPWQGAPLAFNSVGRQ